MIIDLMFLGVAIYGLYIGFGRGIIKTVFTVASVVFGIVVAFRFSPDLTEFLETAFDSDNPLLFIPGFLLTLVITMILIRSVAKVFENGLKTANINFINQAAGAALTAAFTTLLFSLLLWFGDQAHLIKPETKRESFTYSFLERYPKATWDVLKKAKPSLQKFWGRSLEFLDRMEDYRVESSESEHTIYNIDEEGRRTPRETNN